MNEFQEHQRRQRRNAAERAYEVFNFARKHNMPLEVSEELLSDARLKSEPDVTSSMTACHLKTVRS